MIKKLGVLMAVAMLAFTFNASAQAFNGSTKMITVAIGGADMFHVPVGYSFYTGFYSPITGQLSVEGEFAVHKYVGVGFNVGVGGRASGYHIGGVGLYGIGAYSGYAAEFNIPVAAVANFHFYQLIADKTGKNLHADKLDIYAGASVGSGIAIHPGIYDYNNGNKVTGTDVLVIVGLQAGVRYYFTPKIAVNGEFGWGKTFARAGITFNL